MTPIELATAVNALKSRQNKATQEMLEEVEDILGKLASRTIIVLPERWGMKEDAVGRTYFLDHQTRTTQWSTPVGTITYVDGVPTEKQSKTEHANTNKQEKAYDQILRAHAAVAAKDYKLAYELYMKSCDEGDIETYKKVAKCAAQFNPKLAADTYIKAATTAQLKGYDVESANAFAKAGEQFTKAALRDEAVAAYTSARDIYEFIGSTATANRMRELIIEIA